jgi:hypothetical protein
MKCLVDGCEGEAKTRGLCHKCYQTAFMSVKKGKTTWDELVKLGLVKPASSCPPGRSDFSKALAERRAAASQGLADPSTGERIDTITGGEVTFDESGDIGGGEDAGAPHDGMRRLGRRVEQDGVVVHVPVPPPAGYLREVSDSIEPQEVAQGPRNVPSGPPPWAR